MAEPRPTHSLAASLVGGEASLVDVIDSLVDKGVVLQGDVALGIAGIDLITLKLAALVVSAERLADSAGRIDAPLPPEAADDPAPSAAGTAAARQPPDTAASQVGGPEGVPARSADSVTTGQPPLDAQPTVRVASSLDSADTGASRAPIGRWDVDPDDVRRSVMKLVLTLVEVIRQLLERRAIRQMEADHLSDAEVERLGRSLHELEQTILDLAAQAGLDPADLNLDLGPLGRLL